MKTKNSDIVKKEKAKQLFTDHSMVPNEIANLLELNVSIIENWIEKEKWDGIKKSILPTDKSNINVLYSLLEKLLQKIKSEDELNPKDVDLVLKYSAAIKNLETEVSIAEIVEVAIIFTKWLSKKNQKLGITIANHFDNFITFKLKEDSF